MPSLRAFSPRELEEALRKEVRVIRGLRWFVGTDLFTPAKFKKKGEPPNIAGRVSFARRISPTETLIADVWLHQVYIIDFDWEVLWEFGKVYTPGDALDELREPFRADYNPNLDRILIADWGNRRVLEIDRKTKSVVNSLSSSALGTFGRIAAATYNPWNDYRTIVVTDYDNHYVAELRWDGSVVWSAGAYGVPGNSLTPLRLNNPYYAEMVGWVGVAAEEFVAIADFRNNRVLEYNTETGAVIAQFIVPRATFARFFGAVNRAICGDAEVAIIGDNDNPARWHTPFITQYLCDLTPENTVLFISHGNLFEVDLKANRIPHTLPIGVRWWREKSLSAGVAETQPFWTIGYKRVVVSVKANQTGRLEILNLKPETDMWFHSELTIPPSWEVYDEKPISANVPLHYLITSPQPCMGVRVTLDVDGKCDFWLSKQ